MKENSIEEDIEEKLNKNLDFLIKNANKMEQLTAVNIVAMKQPTILLFLSILSDYKRVLKENEELKEKENKIYEEVQECLSFEKFLIAKKREPDLFNQGRFYISQIIYDILNNVEKPEGIHKENKNIIDNEYISKQKIKNEIKELNKYYKKEIYPELYNWSDLTITEHYDEMIELLQELLESEE